MFFDGLLRRNGTAATFLQLSPNWSRRKRRTCVGRRHTPVNSWIRSQASATVRGGRSRNSVSSNSPWGCKLLVRPRSQNYGRPPVGPQQRHPGHAALCDARRPSVPRSVRASRRGLSTTTFPSVAAPADWDVRSVPVAITSRSSSVNSNRRILAPRFLRPATAANFLPFGRGYLPTTSPFSPTSVCAILNRARYKHPLGESNPCCRTENPES